jgi:hypothetical protein
MVQTTDEAIEKHIGQWDFPGIRWAVVFKGMMK